jgi:CRP-like cAMP-binding protein
LKEEFYEKGTEIITSGENCTQIFFVVQGTIELQVVNSIGEKFVLETLKQGDIIG